MIDFNVDFLTKQLKNQIKTKALKGYHQHNVQNIVNLVALISRKINQHNAAIAFIRISVSRRIKVEKLICIERSLNRCLERGWMAIKRFGVLNGRCNSIKEQNKLNYPLGIVNRILSNNKLGKLQIGWNRLLRNKKELDLARIKLEAIELICYQYQKRLFLRQIFNIYNKSATKQAQYNKYAPHFSKIIERIQNKHLKNGLNNIVFKTELKAISQLQKSKTSKRDESVKSVSKRNEAVNDLKRKTNNLKGQVNQQILRNNKRRTDGLKENGLKLMKKNQQMRGYQIQYTQLLNEYQRMEREIQRKINYISSRPKNTIPFDQIRVIYSHIYSNTNATLTKSQLQTQIVKQQANDFINTPNYIKSQNAKLKYLINLYEKLESGKKSDIYISLDNENNCLKGLISSFMRMQYFEPKREQMLNNIDEINSNMQQFKRSMGQLREERLQIGKK